MGSVELFTVYDSRYWELEIHIVSQSHKMNYIYSFAGFHEWSNGQPGYQFSGHMPRRSRPHPWKNLFDMAADSFGSLYSQIPILPLHWRVRLSHHSQRCSLYYMYITSV